MLKRIHDNAQARVGMKVIDQETGVKYELRGWDEPMNYVKVKGPSGRVYRDSPQEFGLTFR